MPVKIKQQLAFAFATGTLLLALGLIMYYIIFPGQGYFHADCTDTIYWAQASYLSKKIFDPDFTYAAMLPFGGSLLMLPWIGIFGMSMTTHTIGMVLFALCLIGAFLFFFRSLKVGWTGSFWFTAMATMLLSSTDKLREMFWGHVIYYSLGVLFYLVGTGLVVRLLDKTGKYAKKQYIIYGVLCLFMFLTALDGIQIAIIFALPLAAALFLESFFNLEKPLLDKQNHRSLSLFLSIIGVTLLGLLVLELLKNGQRAYYADGYSGFSPASEWGYNCLKLFNHWFSLFGGTISGTISVFSMDLLWTLIRFVLALILAVFPIMGLCFYRKITNRTIKIVIISHFVLMFVILAGFIFGSLGAANWRFIPLLASCIITTLVLLWYFIKELRWYRFGALFLPFLTLGMIASMVQIAKMPANYGRDGEAYELSAFLLENDLTYGYAEFWQSQAITVISNSQVQARNIVISVTGVTPGYYQSSSTWFEDQDGIDNYFVIVNTADLYWFEYSSVYNQYDDFVTEEYTVGDYVIYVFSENPFS
ncbi:MAG: hypothetical protein WC296_05830 [Candidatus Izemoplasmatales bacterium]|jgi:hypothetical protein|nr:hypothetical protein [Candidatus Izemoplasmatales bacterium]MDD4595950.1 hypothetical protein [Candidatus Izemoplasmatales bacterium]